jgi:threonyl-tRNA synthetase
VQAVVIPIADRHLDAARELAAELRAGGLRFVEVDASDNRMQNKIRLAQGQKIPYMLILGDREIEARQASVRRRDGSQEQGVPWADLAARLGAEARDRALG